MIEETMLEAAEKMDKAVEVAKEDFATIRTGRANPALFSKVTVNYYGSPTPLQQLASFQNPEARTLLITPFDKSALNDIEKALRDSDVGVVPVVEDQGSMRLRGVVTDRDIAIRVVAEGRNGDTSTRDVMSSGLATVGPDDDVGGLDVDRYLPGGLGAGRFAKGLDGNPLIPDVEDFE